MIDQMTRTIRTQASDPTVKNLCERIDKGRLKPQGDFQRKYVWQNDGKLKSRLIESVFLEVPIPTIYTAEEKDGSEIVIDGQQRLLTFHSFLNNGFRLTGLTVIEYLNHKNYKALGDIDAFLQEKIDDYPLRVIKILKDSDPSVRFDIFERLNRGSVKLNDQELRNCIYRGTFNDFLKEVSQFEDFQILFGSKEHKRMQDVEFALRFFALYELTYLKYKPPIKHFLNSFMRKFQEIDDEKQFELRRVFRQSATLVKTVFGDRAFNLYTSKDDISGKQDKIINQGLFDVLMNGFTIYDQNQVMPYKDALKEELYWLVVNNDDFIGSISGAGTGTKDKFVKKMEIWSTSLKEIIGSPKTEPRCFSWEIKKQLFEGNPVCDICGQQIESIDDSEVDHIEFYWRGGKTIPENARLVHRFCNRSRRQKEKVRSVMRVRKDDEFIKENESLNRIEQEIRSKIHKTLSRQKIGYWEECIPENIKSKVKERVENEITKYPYEEKALQSEENKINFCDVRDYRMIIRSNWNVFSEIFISKSELDKHCKNLAEYRNAVAHGRSINTVAKKGGEAAIEWFSRVLNYEKS